MEDNWYLEIFSAEAGKDKGAKRLQALTGADRLVAFGDNLNDLPLLPRGHGLLCGERARGGKGGGGRPHRRQQRGRRRPVYGGAAGGGGHVITKLLIRAFVKNPDKVEDAGVRFAYGKMAGGAGLCANLLLFLAKLAAGLLAGSVAVMADAFNNLSDAGLLHRHPRWFKLSSAPPDREHPFGHGRMEYVSALGVAALIMAARL